MEKKLTKSSNKLLAGVCAGIAEYFPVGIVGNCKNFSVGDYGGYYSRMESHRSHKRFCF